MIFNRTIVELKQAVNTHDIQVLLAFNRTIVELKHASDVEVTITCDVF